VDPSDEMQACVVALSDQDSNGSDIDLALDGFDDCQEEDDAIIEGESKLRDKDPVSEETPSCDASWPLVENNASW
jgi:hypothetical protein